MGMTLWVHTLNGRTLRQDEDDHSYMNRLSNELDQVCTGSNLPKLSNFFDYTDLNCNMAEEEVRAIDPETGWAYGIDDMQWFDAAAGAHTLRSLEFAVAGGAIPTLDASAREELLWELGHAAGLVEAAAAQGGKFHLAVVM